MPPEKLSLHIENQIERFRNLGHSRIKVSGTSSPTALALLISQAQSLTLSVLPHLVVLPLEKDVSSFKQSLAFFAPGTQCFELPAFDVSPYSGLEPGSGLIAERLRFLWQAQLAQPNQVFVGSIKSFLQKSLSFQALAKNSFLLKVEGELPAGFQQALVDLGYEPSPLVESVGQFSIRGGIVDLFSPAHSFPIRLELFGDLIESMKFFDPDTQRSAEAQKSCSVIPCRESLWNQVPLETLVGQFKKSLEGTQFDKSEFEDSLRAFSKNIRIPGIDFIFPFFHSVTSSVLEHFGSPLNIWQMDPISLQTQSDQLMEEMRAEHSGANNTLIRPDPQSVWLRYEDLEWPPDSNEIKFFPVLMDSLSQSREDSASCQFSTHSIAELANSLATHKVGSAEWTMALSKKLLQWKNDDYCVLLSVRHQTQVQRLKTALESQGLALNFVEEIAELNLEAVIEQQRALPGQIHLVQRSLDESVRFSEEKLILLRDQDLFGRKTGLRKRPDSEEFQKQARRLSFGDLKPGDCVVHSTHGIGIYDGLKIMNIGGADSEFIQISYKDKDKLYLPVYRIGQLNRYSGVAGKVSLDRLGSNLFEKAKSKVKSALRDLASDLLALYAKRAELKRPIVHFQEPELRSFEAGFPYDETEDQLKAINDLEKDLLKETPMDRLVCGDVGFGKTEVAMRAAFAMVSAQKQVALLCPTTVLSFQHLETLKKRFQQWPIEIRALNRFVPTSEAKKTLALVKEGKVDILIGTHRILSKDVEFRDLGLLIIDEEQKFGVAHKERIRKIKVGVDTLSMSATPIPRTLNLSLSGIRDLSLINTAPVDRLPTRTFITKWDNETIKKALLAEVQRGGQIYFIHNRIQSIYGLADELRTLVPELRIKVAHGQMPEEELETTMVAFFKHEIDMLICTAIVESGMDVPRANTMFIDQAHTLGLSQLYQLRGRVGRSKQRAYCYLLLPRTHQLDKSQQERLKVIQENTALGSGIRIAQYDLELRGAGNILGEEQSGHIDAVGYELYMDLLSDAIETLKTGAPPAEEIDPEINLRIPALIPDSYISDIRIRLSYYKALAEVRSAADLETLESELRDQFGTIPEPTLNLMGLMLIRSVCRELGIKDLSAGPKNLSLLFSSTTKIKSETVIKMTMKENKKYSLTPDSRLIVRMNEISWARALEELELIKKWS